MASATTATTTATNTTTNRSPEHLRGKISQVKHLLDDASKRLQDEASKYTASFKNTQTSAIQMGNANISNNNLAKQPQIGTNGSTNSSNNNNDRDVPNDLIRTISDINTLKSVLSCPIFDRIVNVTDSLDKLSYHLNLHPSIGPSDINFDPNGELILAPPIESMTTNEFLNNRLNGLNGHSTFTNQLQLANTTTDPHPQSSSTNGEQALGDNIARQPSSFATPKSTRNSGMNGSSNHTGTSIPHSSNGARSESQPPDQQKRTSEAGDDGYMTPSPTDREISYGTEKLVSNGNAKCHVNNNGKNSSAKDRVRSTETQVDSEKSVVSMNAQEGSRLYKTNGHFALNEVASNRTGVNYEPGGDKVTDTRMSHMELGVEDDVTGYSNEMYNTAPSQLATGNNLPAMMDYQKISTSDVQDSCDAENKNNGFAKPVPSRYTAELGDTKSQTAPESKCQRSSCSPSTSGDSTVRMADDCDSGASSYQSQALRNAQNMAVYTNEEAKVSHAHPVQQRQQQHAQEQQLPTPSNETTQADGCNADENSENMDQDLIEKFSPDMERIKVTLEKDSNGLGITIAGYTCEKEEISGIFIKSITPNSPAYKSGKIRTLDQIFAVNGRELLGYSNPEAVNVLRNTGKKVTLELMRYLAESKYRKLQIALAHAVPSISAKGGRSNGATRSAEVCRNRANDIPSSNIVDDELSSSSRDANRMSMDSNRQVAPQLGNGACFNESLYNNTAMPASGFDSSFNRIADESGVPSSTLSRTVQNEPKFLSKQCIGSTKVIETKQGARNTIDIKSPTCQASNATYVNRSLDLDYRPAHSEHGAVNTNITSRMHLDETDDFGCPIRPEWEEEVQIVELQKDSSQGLGFTVKEYVNPKDQKESIIMIRAITPGGVAERNGRLSSGDLLIFVDDISLRGASLAEAVRTLKRVDRQVSLGVLKLKRQ